MHFTAGPTNRSMPSATVLPILHYPDVLLASKWLCEVFGFAERLRIGNHRMQLAVGDGAIVVAHGPGTSPGQSSPFTMMVRVVDVDEHYQMVKAAGGETSGPPMTHPYGERQYTATDLIGNVWTFSQSVADVDPANWGGELIASS